MSLGHVPIKLLFVRKLLHCFVNRGLGNNFDYTMADYVKRLESDVERNELADVAHQLS